MPLGISTLCTIGKTFEKINELVNTGIDVLEIMDDWRDRLTKRRIDLLNDICNSFEIEYTVHCPILDINIAATNDKVRKLAIKIIKDSMEKARNINAKIYVIHPGFRTPLENFVPNINKNLNILSLKEILHYGEELGLKVAIENMPARTRCLLQNVNEFFELEEEGISPYIVLDVGHANTTSQLEIFLSKLNNKIIHVHLHDNYGIEDEHRVIGEGNINWQLVKSYISFDKIYGVVENNTLKEAKISFKKALQTLKS
ncbi:MAG: sugar phosphate isomerase/epimerase [Candidatus Verstraetearchaeota archaeon]|jgi:sugar phosphate isomerase/epimerase|nr:sugar phosphate isomerase/epimerase [Candidatus Methanomethylicia archaeon]NHV45345.1 sugar phosphate isomerase/epimerase [Candidatus Verstraetearchaeota archaeon]